MADLLERLKAPLADRYRIERELGLGGMTTVYLAQDLKRERQLACGGSITEAGTRVLAASGRSRRRGT
jgi:hypothetical protein